MNAPLYKFGAFGDETSLVVAFLIGLGSAGSWRGPASATPGS